MFTCYMLLEHLVWHGYYSRAGTNREQRLIERIQYLKFHAIHATVVTLQVFWADVRYSAIYSIRMTYIAHMLIVLCMHHDRSVLCCRVRLCD